jgi:hypothetical protein
MTVTDFIWVTVIFLLYGPLIQIIHHEYISHEYIKPKNIVYEFLLLIIFYCALGQSVMDKKRFHSAHHRLWKDPTADPTRLKISASRSPWQYIFGLSPAVSHDTLPDIKPASFVRNSLFVKFFDTHAFSLYVLCRILVLLCLSWNWFLVVVVWVPWLLRLMNGANEYVFHGPTQHRENSLLLPIYGSQTWHIRHHTHWKTYDHGPGIWQWLNLCWYYQLLFFKDVNNINNVAAPSSSTPESS